MLGRLIAVLAFSRRTDCLTGRNLTPKEKARLIDKLGPAGYLALPYGEPDQPRDPGGRWRRR